MLAIMILLSLCSLPALADVSRSDARQVTAAEHSPDHLDYRVKITALPDERLDRAIGEGSLLSTLREDGPLNPFALIARAENDIARIDRVLRSFGYYDALIVIRIAGQDLADPTLPARLEQLASGGAEAVEIEVEIDPGPRYRIEAVRLQGEVPAAARAALDLKPGDPALAPQVLAAGTALLQALQELGYPLAQVPPPAALVDHRTRTMTLSFDVQTGARLPLGEIEIIGLKRLREGYVRRRLGLQPGEPFSPSRLEAARRSLIASETLASARLSTAEQADASGRLPLRLEVVERPPRVLRLAGAYSSDQSGSLSVGWTHRNLLGGAERLTFDLELSRIAPGALGDINDAAQIGLRIPDIIGRDLDLQLRLGAVRERLDAYERDAILTSALFERRFSPRLSLSAGLGLEQSQVAQDGPTQDFRLLSLPLTLTFDSTDDPLDPRRGLRLSAQLTPTSVPEGDGSAFLRARLAAATYLDLSGSRSAGSRLAAADASDPPLLGRRVLAARIAIGRILGASASAVPPDWRFYAGGGGSVRGYPFQSIGPRTRNGSPAGGDTLIEGSLELRQRFGQRWGITAFVDLGDVSRDGFPGVGNLAVGAGLGLRFHTPVGPVRADLATPLTQSEGDPPVQLYIGIGQAF
ncbi:autotransporter assembly complex protein TamA [Halochromatium glycolicum]|uniref:POTRA domain-containing protein n=1 Tax=Halochromatium glycolicum TaxID=85075 RepID=A0AAJ0U2X9_9GAMM|nr:autotransporter assembly complex family protein [Halochromatium glycolicum]MBK1704321.1 hypothetical protein [Halochromatium glycolicum]